MSNQPRFLLKDLNHRGSKISYCKLHLQCCQLAKLQKKKKIILGAKSSTFCIDKVNTWIYLHFQNSQENMYALWSIEKVVKLHFIFCKSLFIFACIFIEQQYFTNDSRVLLELHLYHYCAHFAEIKASIFLLGKTAFEMSAIFI